MIVPEYLKVPAFSIIQLFGTIFLSGSLYIGFDNNFVFTSPQIIWGLFGLLLLLWAKPKKDFAV